MARFRGLFKKGPKQDSEPDERKPQTRRGRQIEEESALSEALEEIEAESEMPDMGNIEDELIQLEDEAGIASEATQQVIFNQLSEKLNEMDAKIRRFDNVVNTVKNDVRQFQEQLGQIEEDMRKLLSVYEIVSARFNPFIDMKDEEVLSPESIGETAESFGNEIELQDLLDEGTQPPKSFTTLNDVEKFYKTRVIRP